MKIILFFACIILFGCGKKISDGRPKMAAPQTIEVVELDAEDKYWDSICKIESASAKKDIRLGMLKYFHYFGMVRQYRSNQEMNKLLTDHHIAIDSASYYCTVPGNLQNCYAHRMREEIDRKFGKNFIDSLRNVAEMQYVKNNPDRIYDFHECDTLSRYPNDKNYSDFFETTKRDYFKMTPYPEGFEFRKDDDLYSWISADFILHKDGSVTDIDIRLEFQNKKNDQYASYFISRLKEFIAQTKWIPAKSMGESVNSTIPLTIHFK